MNINKRERNENGQEWRKESEKEIASTNSIHRLQLELLIDLGVLVEGLREDAEGGWTAGHEVRAWA